LLSLHSSLRGEVEGYVYLAFITLRKQRDRGKGNLKYTEKNEGRIGR
jgi:hypothetical protein